jgi:hypothetical protein
MAEEQIVTVKEIQQFPGKDKGLLFHEDHKWAHKGDWLQTSVKFCHWAAPETTDLSELVFQTALSYAAYALIVLNTVQAIRIADLRYEVAKGYADLARSRWDRFSSRFKPLEAMLVAESLADPEVEPDYENARAVYTGCAADPGGEQRHLDLARMYGLCPDPALYRAAEVSRGLHLDDMVNLGYRDETDHALLADIDRWNRRLELLNLGRDLPTLSLEAARQGDALLEQGAAQAAQGVNGAVGFLTYLRDYRDTAYSDLGIVMPAATSTDFKNAGV